ncbi:MAG: hypothetical protein ACI37Q_08275 [Candidatus Gastranaerophilaceae bacterium]
MAIEFNRFNKNYDNYSFAIGQKVSQEAKKAEETKETVKSNAEFKGLENETDLLTQNTQYIYGVKLGQFTLEDKELAEQTNEILASLGYNYKVTAAQVASVTNGVKTVVEPGLKLAEDGAVAAHIQDPNGPFAELFT